MDTEVINLIVILTGVIGVVLLVIAFAAGRQSWQALENIMIFLGFLSLSTCAALFFGNYLWLVGIFAGIGLVLVLYRFNPEEALFQSVGIDKPTESGPKRSRTENPINVPKPARELPMRPPGVTRKTLR